MYPLVEDIICVPSIELQMKVPKDYGKFYNHREAPKLGHQHKGHEGLGVLVSIVPLAARSL